MAPDMIPYMRTGNSEEYSVAGLSERWITRVEGSGYRVEFKAYKPKRGKAETPPSASKSLNAMLDKPFARAIILVLNDRGEALDLSD